MPATTRASDEPASQREPAPGRETIARRFAQTGILLLAGWVVFVCALLFANGSSPPLPEGEARTSIRLDPNTAGWTELAALPGLGPGLARRIVAYRETYERDHGDDRPFRSPADLEDVRGIGPKRSAQLEPFLRFQPSPQTDAPISRTPETS